MIRTFRLALAHPNSAVGDIDGNTARILEYVERAREFGADPDAIVSYYAAMQPGTPWQGRLNT